MTPLQALAQLQQLHDQFTAGTLSRAVHQFEADGLVREYAQAVTRQKAMEELL